MEFVHAARVDRLALDRRRGRKCASRQKLERQGERAFALAAQLPIASRENPFCYDERASGRRIYAYVANSPLIYSDSAGLSPFSGMFKDLFSDFFTTEAAKAISGARQFGSAVGTKVCKATGGNIPDPFTTCGADCANYNTPAAGNAAYDLFEECVKACQDEIKKCKGKPGPVSLACK